MRVLVTGARGFVGRHVLAELAGAGHEGLAVDLPGPDVEGASGTWVADLRDRDAIGRVLADTAPQGCIHLGGIAYVPMSWRDPVKVFETNLLGTVNLLEGFRAHAPAARVLVASSAEVYGPAAGPAPLIEEAPPNPANPYAVSKWAADAAARLYAARYGMGVMTARPGNHIGPGQSPRFVVTSFAQQVAAVAAGRAPALLRVGNLESRRDFMDVRDVARGYRLLLERGGPGEAYNMASGRLVTVRSVLDTLCALAGVSPRIEVDPERYRPADAAPLLDCSKIARAVGWTPRTPLEDTLRIILADVRQRGEKAGPS